MEIKANGITINYDLSGPQDAPVVILSHSLATHLGMWDSQMATLLPHFRVLRFDTRGHGRSEAPGGDYTLEILSGDLFSLMDQLRIETAHYVGLSMGGMIGQAAVLQNPQRFLSLSLCDTSSQIPKEALSVWEERIAIAQRQGMNELVDSTISRWFSGQFQKSNKGDVDRIREMIRTTHVEGFCGCSRAIMKLDLTNRLSSIKLPTLLLVGEHDSGTPVIAHETIPEHIFGSELVVIPNALHLSNIEEKGEFNANLLNFLIRHR